MKLTSNQALSSLNNYDIEQVVIERYQTGVKVRQPSLCCTIEYEDSYLTVLPKTIFDKDYGCGNFTLYIFKSKTVLDLGYETGKNCYTIAKKFVEKGKLLEFFK